MVECPPGRWDWGRAGRPGRCPGGGRALSVPGGGRPGRAGRPHPFRGTRSRRAVARGAPVAAPRTGRSRLQRRPGRGHRRVESPSELALAVLLGQARPDQLVTTKSSTTTPAVTSARPTSLSRRRPRRGRCSSRVHAHHAKAVLRPGRWSRQGGPGRLPITAFRATPTLSGRPNPSSCADRFASAGILPTLKSCRFCWCVMPKPNLARTGTATTPPDLFPLMVCARRKDWLPSWAISPPGRASCPALRGAASRRWAPWLGSAPERGRDR